MVFPMVCLIVWSVAFLSFYYKSKKSADTGIYTDAGLVMLEDGAVSGTSAVATADRFEFRYVGGAGGVGVGGGDSGSGDFSSTSAFCSCVHDSVYNLDNHNHSHSYSDPNTDTSISTDIGTVISAVTEVRSRMAMPPA